MQNILNNCCLSEKTRPEEVWIPSFKIVVEQSRTKCKDIKLDYKDTRIREEIEICEFSIIAGKPPKERLKFDLNRDITYAIEDSFIFGKIVAFHFF